MVWAGSSCGYIWAGSHWGMLLPWMRVSHERHTGAHQNEAGWHPRISWWSSNHMFHVLIASWQPRLCSGYWIDFDADPNQLLRNPDPKHKSESPQCETPGSNIWLWCGEGVITAVLDTQPSSITKWLEHTLPTCGSDLNHALAMPWPWPV